MCGVIWLDICVRNDSLFYVCLDDVTDGQQQLLHIFKAIERFIRILRHAADVTEQHGFSLVRWQVTREVLNDVSESSVIVLDEAETTRR